MSVSKVTYDVIEEQLNKVVMLPYSRVLQETAMKLSFYVAMVDAAKDDPMDEEDEQQELLTFFENKIKELTEEYQEIVNDLI